MAGPRSRIMLVDVILAVHRNNLRNAHAHCHAQRNCVKSVLESFLNVLGIFFFFGSPLKGAFIQEK